MSVVFLRALMQPAEGHPHSFALNVRACELPGSTRAYCESVPGTPRREGTHGSPYSRSPSDRGPPARRSPGSRGCRSRAVPYLRGRAWMAARGRRPACPAHGHPPAHGHSRLRRSRRNCRQRLRRPRRSTPGHLRHPRADLRNSRRLPDPATTGKPGRGPPGQIAGRGALQAWAGRHRHMTCSPTGRPVNGPGTRPGRTEIVALAVHCDIEHPQGHRTSTGGFPAVNGARHRHEPYREFLPADR